MYSRLLSFSTRTWHATAGRASTRRWSRVSRSICTSTGASSDRTAKSGALWSSTPMSPRAVSSMVKRAVFQSTSVAMTAVKARRPR